MLPQWNLLRDFSQRFMCLKPNLDQNALKVLQITMGMVQLLVYSSHTENFPARLTHSSSFTLGNCERGITLDSCLHPTLMNLITSSYKLLYLKKT